MKKMLCGILILCFLMLIGCGSGDNGNLSESNPTKQEENVQKELDIVSGVPMSTPNVESESISEPLLTNTPTLIPTGNPSPTSEPTPTTILITEYTQDLKYELVDDGTYFIVKGAYDKNIQELFIPKLHEGKPVMGIGGEAFEGYAFLTTVVVPNTVTSIGVRAFANCKKLETVVLSENLEKVSRDLFYGCTELKKVHLPNTITDIEDGAFQRSGLQEINIPEGVVSIGYHAFAETYLRELHIPASVEKIGLEICYPGMGIMSRLKKVTVAEGNEKYHERGNCVLNNEGLVMMGANGSTIPDNATAIRTGAFCGCNLGKVYLPDTVVEIYDNAFKDATIEELRLSEGLKYIGSGAFESVDVLSKVSIPKSVNELCSSAFASCFNLKEVEVEGKTSIDFYAFSYCTGLEKVMLSRMVEDIDENAFDGCAKVVLYVDDSSYVKRYALEKGIAYTVKR